MRWYFLFVQKQTMGVCGIGRKKIEYNSILDAKAVICKYNNEQYLWMIIENWSKDIFAPIMTNEWYPYYFLLYSHVDLLFS